MNDEINKICSDARLDSDVLDYLEEMVLSYEEYKPDIEDPSSLFTSRGVVESIEQLENFYSVLFEKSHKDLKYAYRIGFDIDTGDRVAIQFELLPSDITVVGDKAMTSAVFPNKTKDDINKMHSDALSEVKKTIKRYGHIDHLSKSLKVLSIFHKDGKQISSVRLVPVFGKGRELLMQVVSTLIKSQPRLMQNNSVEKLIQSDTFKSAFIDEAKQLKKGTWEEYHISKDDNDRQGANKYKTTKLFWNMSNFSQFQFTPKVRGYTRGQLPVTNYDKYTINNSPGIGDIISHRPVSSYSGYIKKIEYNIGILRKLSKNISDMQYKNSSLSKIDDAEKILNSFKNIQGMQEVSSTL